jgi:hypothetical protein
VRARANFAMLIRMALGGFRGVMAGLQGVAVGDVPVVGALFVVVRFVMLRGFVMVLSCGLMVLGGFAMMIDDFLAHGISLSWTVFRNVDRAIFRSIRSTCSLRNFHDTVMNALNGVEGRTKSYLARLD